ncbi:methionine synthase reductase-like isoform X2 [Periplaneta americana]|uniref:methionine synthase reductase-like isoform X2 n=1 Tax=Periplaneta americana TaxID=6978 RepID=UPI0037E86AC4
MLSNICASIPSPHNMRTIKEHFSTTDVMLTLPVLPPDYLELHYVGKSEEERCKIQNGCMYPFAVGLPFLATVVSAQQLTHGEDVKKIVDICLDIQVFLCVLASCTEDSKERRRLEELCSKEGSSDYSEFVIAARVTLLDLLEAFPSCCPPVERILEHLPRLQARPYSIASSPLQKPSGSTQLHIVYSLIELPVLSHGGSDIRYGTCTGWLDSLTKPIQTKRCDDILIDEMEKLKLSNIRGEMKIPIYLRKSSNFKLPEDLSVPLILIGPGTGVAPFIGFLQHRLEEKQRNNEVVIGDIWLFFGCRYKDKDFLYRLELENYFAEGILTRLFLSFSRDKRKGVEPKYVQDNIRLHSKEFVHQIFEKNSTIYVCGDAKNMGKDVFEVVVSVIEQERAIEEQEARLLVSELQSQGRYLQDIWI